MPLTVADVAGYLDGFAPPHLAAEWDNVGLLLGDRAREVRKVMTCLTITPDSAAEAVDERADLIVTHHPLPFRPLRRLTTDTPEGRLLWKLATAGISIYSPHTAFDSAAAGINQKLAEGIELRDIAPLVPSELEPHVGQARHGTLQGAVTLGELAGRLKQYLSIPSLQTVGPPDRSVRQVALACGSAGEYLTAAATNGCQCLVTGETRFHTCLEAEATGMTLILLGHFASERFALEHLATVLAEQFSALSVWASRRERDPLSWV